LTGFRNAAHRDELAQVGVLKNCRSTASHRDAKIVQALAVALSGKEFFGQCRDQRPLLRVGVCTSSIRMWSGRHRA
jgi:hypothetical protein